MDLKAVRGMHDLYGDEMSRWRYVEDQIRALFDAFGYREFRTPALEKIEVFKHTVGDETDIVEKQMYTLNDQGNETLVLRPEGTASVIRSVVENQLYRPGHPLRYYYYQPMYRYERPQKGRLRQFHQFGGELLNDPTPEADAEIIALMDQTYRLFGISEYEVRVNNVGCSECRPPYKEVLKSFFRPKLGALCEQCQKRFERSPLRILDCKRDECQAVAAKAPRILENLCAVCSAHHVSLKRRLSQIGVTFIEDSNIVRGLDYYMRTAFEFTSNLLGAQSALGGGGRYDGVSARFGADPFPAVGYAIGMERLMLVLDQKQSLGVSVRVPKFFFIPLGMPAFEMLYPLSLKLRRNGVWAEMSYDASKGLKWQLKQADRVNADFALMLGDQELSSKHAILKNMKAGTQENISLDTLENALMGRAQRAI